MAAVMALGGKLPNFIDLTGSDEDDDDVKSLIPMPVERHAPSTLPPVFSDPIQDTLLEAAKESTRRLVAGNLLATIPSRGPSKTPSSIPKKRPNALTSVVRSQQQAGGIFESRHASPPSLKGATAPLTSPPRTESWLRSPALARTQATIEGFFHKVGPSSEGQYGGKGIENSAGNIHEIRKRKTLKKQYITKERSEEPELIRQINQSSSTSEEKAMFIEQIKGSAKKEPSTGGSGIGLENNRKAAVDSLRTQIILHLVGIMNVFKDIKTFEERKEIGMETARKMFAAPYFRETLLRGNATSSKVRDNQIKAFVKASLDEVILERERRAAVADRCVRQGSQGRGSGDGVELGLDEAAEAIVALDGLTDVDMSELECRLVDQNGSFIDPARGRTTPSKRTADGAIKAPSVNRVDNPLSPHLGVKVAPQGNAGAGPKMPVLPRPYYRTLASESETRQQAKPNKSFAPRASRSLQLPPPLKDPTRRHIVKLSVGRAHLLRFAGEDSSVKPVSNHRSADFSIRHPPPLDGTKLQLLRSKSSSNFAKGKSISLMTNRYTLISLVLALIDLTIAAKTKDALPELGNSGISRASKVLDELSTSLQHLSSLVRSPSLQNGSLNRVCAQTVVPLTKHGKPFAALRRPAPFGPSSPESVSSDKMSGRRSSRRILRRNLGQSSGSAQHAAQSPPPTVQRSSNLPTASSLAKDRLMKLVKSPKPFVSVCDRKHLVNGVLGAWWNRGKVLHVDFSEDEMAKVLRVIKDISSAMTGDGIPSTATTERTPLDTNTDCNYSATTMGDNSSATADSLDKAMEARLLPYSGFLEPPVREKIMTLASNMDDTDILSISDHLIIEGVLQGRDTEDVRRFLKDAAVGCLATSPSIIQVALTAPPVKRGDYIFSTSTDSLLRRREFGLGHARGGWHSPEAIESELKLRIYDTMREWRSWNGGSSDTASVAWDVTGEYFAVGFSALTDAYNMQYNRRNNLVLGDVWRNTIKEFPDHRVPRPRTDLVNIVDDLFLYQTVSQVRFGAKSKRMYSASFDKTVKIWDFAASNAPDRLLTTLYQGADVEVMALSADEHLATGSRDGQATVKIWSIDEVNPSSSKIYSSFNSLRKGPVVYPSCMQWGQHSSVNGHLLVGFSGEEGDGPGRRGDIVLWDAGAEARLAVSPGAQTTFDAVWHPSMAAFVVGCTLPGSESARKSDHMRTCVRTYHPVSGGFKDDCELGCPAYDINDVTWSSDANYVTASCTDGNIYVWDTRFTRADRGWLHILQHGEPIIPLPEDEPRERTDTGVRFTQWGPTSDRLYTGSSDGIIKSWNIKRGTQDVLVADVANLRSIIMNGAFSPDHSRLLVGDGKGSIHVLTTGMDDDDPVERMKFEPAEKVEEDGSEGCEEADRLISSGQIMMRRGRPYQGPNYRSADVRRQDLKEELDLIYERIHESVGAALPAGQQGVNSPQQDQGDSRYNAMDLNCPGTAVEIGESRSLEARNSYDPMDLS